MKKYTNLIVIGIILLAVVVFLIVKYVNFNSVLMTMGYYDDKISVINTADIHGHIVFDDETGGYYTIDEVDWMMGMPVMKSVIDGIRKDNKNTLLLDSGDMFHGTNEANVNKAEGVVQVANKMGYDAMTVGNHDFDFGLDRLVQINSELKFPMLSANIYKDGKPLFKEYEIVNVGGKKVALFGMTVQDALMYTNSRDTEGISIEDPVKTAERLVPILKKQADVVILISHLGDEVDKQVVDKVDGIDLILCGHHHFLYQKADKYKNTYLVEAGGYSTHVGLADMYFRNGKLVKVDWSLHRTKDASAADKDMKAIADKYEAVAMEAAKQKVGSTNVVLDGLRSHVRAQETNLGDILADAMKEIGNADAALMNGGGIRESIPKGEIDLYKIGKSLPFVNSLVTVEMKGDKLYDALERGMNLYPNTGINGGFWQVSGINIVYDGSKPAGKRIVSVSINGAPLDKNKYYKIATNDFEYNGGDNYVEFKDCKLLYKGELLKDVLAKYIKEKGSVSPKTEGRIKIINERYK
ncbi:MAG: 5'-nucleotidase C-terminal domain-containing protein [Bacillota bacterium]|nr:5'-nucleotidase C-terminal domain-containing protein [Bacillota bacterium]